MPRYPIERDIDGAGLMTPAELQAVSRNSCDVPAGLGPQVQREHRYLTGDRVYCVYRAPNEALVREHALRGGFPANRISAVLAIIDPLTAK